MKDIQSLINPHKPNLVVISSDDCGPCVKYKKVLTKVSIQSRNEFNIAIVDYEKDLDIYRGIYEVNALPTTLIFDGEEFIGAVEGYYPEDYIYELIRSVNDKDYAVLNGEE